MIIDTQDMHDASRITRASLPAHGPIACRRCFDADGEAVDRGDWRIVNDPGAWGSATPQVLVLGFSKGFTQAGAARSGRFEEVPFKGMRLRLTEVLRTLGLIGPADTVDRRMAPGEERLAFGSLVRCSLSRYEARTRRHECTGPIMAKAFREAEASPIVRRCAETYLAGLPSSVRLVLMLGTGDAYVEGCRRLVRSIRGKAFRDINGIAYRSGDVTWVHASHHSGLNGHHPAWMAADPMTKQGRKRLMAASVVTDAIMGLDPRMDVVGSRVATA